MASPDYLARHGTPATPEDLPAHQCLSYTLGSDANIWQLQQKDGTARAVRISAHAAANNGDAIEAMAVAGAGIALQPSFISHENLASGRLVQVLPGWTSEPLGVHVIYPARTHMALKVRSFIDWLAELYRPAPPWRG